MNLIPFHIQVSLPHRLHKTVHATVYVAKHNHPFTYCLTELLYARLVDFSHLYGVPFVPPSVISNYSSVILGI